MNVLVVAAHPDDEVIGAGGIILRLAAEGHRVYLVVVTEAHPPVWSEAEVQIRKEEVQRASQILGIEKVFFGGFRTVELNTVPTLRLSRAISEFVEEVKPELVLSPPRGDINEDHDRAFKASLVACRSFPGSPVRTLISYEIATTTRYCFPGADTYFIPNYYVDIGPFIERKLTAMAAYVSELRPFPHPRSLEGLRLLARERGLGVGVEYAEAFMLVRSVLPWPNPA